MASVQTWGVDSTFVAAVAPTVQVSSNTGSLVTTTTLTTMIELAASIVNGMITATYGEDAVATFVANADASAQGASVYKRVQFLVWQRLEPVLLGAVHGRVPVADELRDLEEMIRRQVMDLKAAPADLGDTSIADVSLRVATSTNYLGIDTSTDRACYDQWSDPTSGRRKKYW